MNNFTDTLYIVIVLYNIQLEESISFQSILSAKKDNGKPSVFIYDNSPCPQKIKQYAGLQFFYHHDPDNSGVSKAYNEGAKRALDKKKKWILVLDQDTKLPCEIFSFYKDAINNYPKLKLFAPILTLSDGRIFSPCRYRFKRGFHLNEINAGIKSLKEIAPVNSGMLIKIDAFFDAGGYNNVVKLDFSDFQFIERFRKIYPTFCLISIECQQDFSDNEVSLKNQLNRFNYYCEGALHITKDGFWDWAQYYIIVLLRAVKLTIRYKKKDFMIIYFKRFFINSSSAAG